MRGISVAVLAVVVACGPQYTFTPALGAPARPSSDPAAIEIVYVAADTPLPPGVDVAEAERWGSYCGELRVVEPSPSVSLLGVIHAERSNALTGQEVGLDEHDARVRAEAARWGANHLYWCASRYYAFWVQPGPRGPPAEQLMPAVDDRVRALGFAPSGPSGHTKPGYSRLELRTQPDRCYAIGFALDARGAWGEAAEHHLSFAGGVFVAPGEAAIPVPDTKGDRPFAHARAGWFMLGCSPDVQEVWVELRSRNDVGAGGGPFVLQPFVRAATDDERAALDRVRDLERRIEAACTECLPLKLSCEPPGSHCPAFNACIARHGVTTPCTSD